MYFNMKLWILQDIFLEKIFSRIYKTMYISIEIITLIKSMKIEKKKELGTAMPIKSNICYI